MYKKDLALNNLQWLICHKTRLSSERENLEDNRDFYICLFYSLVIDETICTLDLLGKVYPCNTCGY